MQNGDVLGHEFMGEVVEVGPGVFGERLKVGDRVVVPFPIACGAPTNVLTRWASKPRMAPTRGVKIP
jgi:threonine dehydrogenase-like Zn-dependent dehydrogenase